MRPVLAFLALLIVFTLSIPTNVYADSSQECLNSSTLSVNADIILDGTPMSFNENVTCPYGCQNDDCSAGSMLNEVTLVIICSLFALMLLIGYKYKLPPSVMIAGIFMIILATLLMLEGVVIAGTLYTYADSSYVIYLAIMFICIGIYVIATGFGI
jgi:hypothetical protein